jgi:hypothetical protein
MKFNVKDLRRPPPNYQFDPNTNWKKIAGYENYDIAEPATWPYIDEHTGAGYGYNMAPFTVYSREVMDMFFEKYNIAEESTIAKDLMKYLPANLTPFGKFKPIMLAPTQLKTHQKTITNELRKSYKLALKEKRVNTFLALLIKVPVHIQKNDQGTFNAGHLKRKFDEMLVGCNTDTFENHLTNICKVNFPNALTLV